MAGYRPLYTIEEDTKLVRYIVDSHDTARIKGCEFWKVMEKEQILPGRTWQSLKNRWIKYIVKDLGRPAYGLDTESKALLRHAMGIRFQSQIEKKELDVSQPGHSNAERENRKRENRGENRTKEDKAFYSLDMNWSDSDTE